MKRAFWIGLVLLAGVGASALVSYLVYQKMLRPAQAREDAFTALQDGTLTAGPGGKTPLPPRWAIGSEDGNVYVSGSPQGTMWALFPSSVGPGTRFRGELYCNKPNKAAPKGTVDLECTPSGKPAAAQIVRALSPFGFEVVNDK